jgi:hypothetical protein
MAVLLAIAALVLAWMFLYKNHKTKRLIPGSR